MLKAVLLSTAALALVATSADANSKLTFSNHNRYVSVLPGSSSHNVPHFAPKVSYIYSTLSKNKEGAYFCCYGSTISGPSSSFGAAYGAAEQFTLAKAATVTKLYAGVGYFSGTTNNSVILTLYADNGNKPGTMLAQGTGTTNGVFGFCCDLAKVKISSTNLKANTPYWVAITAPGNAEEAAGFQVNDEVDGNVYVSYTTNGGSSWSSGISETEYNIAIGLN